VPVILSDATYAKPTTAWLRDHFWPWFQKMRWNLGLNHWTRKNDCDSFSRAYAQAAQDCHALTVGETEEGLAVGQFYYIGTTHVQGPHAICVAFTDDGKIYIEPQTGQRLALTPTEELSCFACLL
jgi:hypothetical protein